MSSKNWMVAGVIAPVVFVAGCLVTIPEEHVRTVPLLLAPPLPPIVVFDTEQTYYVQEGYHYHYQNDMWYYSRSRSGPWTILPRDRCPREVRYRDGGHRHDTGPRLQVLIAPPLPSIVLFDTEPYYVQGGYHYHYQNNGWYYSRSRSGPWTSLPKDRYPREVRYRDGRDKDGRHGDDRGHAPRMTQPTTPYRHQEIKKPDHRERVQPSKEQKPTVPSPTRQPAAVQPRKEVKSTVTPSVRQPEISQPPRDRKVPVMPPAKQPKTVQPQKEREAVVTQPVVESKGKAVKESDKDKEQSR